MKKMIKHLTAEEVETLLKRFESLKFSRASDLIYEAQVPNTGIVLVRGQLELIKRKKVQLSLVTPALLGVDNLLKDIPSKLGLKVLPDSELILLNKAELMTAKEDKDTELYEIIKGSYS